MRGRDKTRRFRLLVSEPRENRENQGSQPRAGGFRKARRGQLARTAGSSCQTEAGQGMLARAQEAMVTRYLAASVTQTKPGSKSWQQGELSQRSGSQIQRQRPPKGHQGDGYVALGGLS